MKRKFKLDDCEVNIIIRALIELRSADSRKQIYRCGG